MLHSIKLCVIFVVFLLAGWLVASGKLQGWLWSTDDLYFKTENSLNAAEQGSTLIGWQTLLGEDDRVLMADLQQKQMQLRREMVENQDEAFRMEAQLTESVLKANTWQSLDGYQVNEALPGQNIQIPGFVVPLEAQQQTLYSFFIVPYFGACLHFPPPPPNQLIYVQYDKGIPLPDIDTPFIFEGQLQAELFEDLLGTAAWSMTLQQMRYFEGNTDMTRLHQ